MLPWRYLRNYKLAFRQVAHLFGMFSHQFLHQLMFKTSIILFSIIVCSFWFWYHFQSISLTVLLMLSKCLFSDDDVLTDFDCCVFDFEDFNECDTGNNTCTTAQVCFNFQGGYTCLDPLQCHSPYIEVSDKWVFLPLDVCSLSHSHT